MSVTRATNPSGAPIRLTAGPSSFVWSSLVLAGLHQSLQGSDLIRRAAHHRGDALGAAGAASVLAVRPRQYVLGALAAVLGHEAQEAFRVEVLPIPHLLAPGPANAAVVGHHEV